MLNFHVHFLLSEHTEYLQNHRNTGAPPRQLLAHLLNCNDRDFILRKARQKGIIQYENVNISIFPDFSLELQKQWASFNEIKQKLRENGTVYSMAYPARLRVEDKGKVLFFTTVEQTQEWL